MVGKSHETIFCLLQSRKVKKHFLKCWLSWNKKMSWFPSVKHLAKCWKWSGTFVSRPGKKSWNFFSGFWWQPCYWSENETGTITSFKSNINLRFHIWHLCILIKLLPCYFWPICCIIKFDCDWDISILWH